jgi:hypothetical protein
MKKTAVKSTKNRAEKPTSKEFAIGFAKVHVPQISMVYSVIELYINWRAAFMLF